MNLEIDRKIAELQRMTVRQLQSDYLRVFGEMPRSRHKQHLVRQIAWRLQALAEGDLSQRARRRAEELACDADLRVRAPRRQPRAAPHAQSTPPARPVRGAPSRAWVDLWVGSGSATVTRSDSQTHGAVGGGCVRRTPHRRGNGVRNVHAL